MEKTAISAEKWNMIITLIIWCAMSAVILPIVLYAGFHKTIVIEEYRQDTATIVENSKDDRMYRLSLQEDSNQSGCIVVPLEKGTKAQQVVLENHYTERELCILLQNVNPDFYKEHGVSGDISIIKEGVLDIQESGVLIRLETDHIYEYVNVMEADKLMLTFRKPKDLYQQILVLEPLGDTREKKEITTRLVTLLQKEVKPDTIRIYSTEMEGSEARHMDALELIEEVEADMYLGLTLSEAEDPGEYGICSYYNDLYYLPEFENVTLADLMTRQVTLAVKNRAIGLFPAEEDSILYQLDIPAARVSLGYLSNEKEKYLLGQETYRQKIAKGLAEGITEVYKERYGR